MASPGGRPGAEGGATKVATARITDDLEKDEPAQMAGTAPTTIPPIVWARTGTPTQAQPAAQIPRISGVATFTFIGDDPQTKTPRVTLQREVGSAFVDVTRRSGRKVDDGEILLAYTPSPLQRSGPQTHFWVAEWQAVPWLGAPNLDALGDRGGLPLGRYRFHVAGNGWTLDSQPFEVVPGGLAAGTPMRTGGNVRVAVNWHAPKGWRLMDMSLRSNQPVPVTSQNVTLELLAPGGAVIGTANVVTDGNGIAQIADNVAATQLRVVDRFGNTQTLTL